MNNGSPRRPVSGRGLPLLDTYQTADMGDGVELKAHCVCNTTTKIKPNTKKLITILERSINSALEKC